MAYDCEFVFCKKVLKFEFRGATEKGRAVRPAPFLLRRLIPDTGKFSERCARLLDRLGTPNLYLRGIAF